MRYPVVLHKDPDSDYGVTVPDVSGCFSAGSSIDEALQAAKEAIECHLEGLLMDGESIPQPGNIEQYQGEADYSGGTWAFVDIDLSRLDSKVKRINITLTERVLTLIDEQAKREGESRSGFLAKAAFEYIGKHKQAF